MSNRRRVKSYREKATDRLAAKRKQAAIPVGMAKVLESIADYGEKVGSVTQLELGDGARPNNMAPSKYMVGKSDGLVVLQRGIDSLWLNIYGVVNEDVLECLAMAKEDALASDGDEALSPLPPFDGTTPLMLSTGVKFYEWHLRSQDVDVQIRKPSKRSPRPMAVVRVSAQALWRLGGGGFVAARLAADWLRPIFEGSSYRVTVSKVHLASDVQGYVPVLADLENVVSRAGDEEYFDEEKGDDAVFRDRKKRLTGVASGKSNNLRLNMYDKVLQVKKKGLTWVFDLWERCAGYKADSPVWRIEFQYGRSWLHGRGIESLDDLEKVIAGLWAYGMAWYSFRVPGGDTNRSRWEVASWWQALSVWVSSAAGDLPRVKVVRPRLNRLAAGLFGYLTSVMAITGHDRYEDAVQAVIGIERDKRGVYQLDRRLAAKQLRYAGFSMGD
jgi:hypothetical protein